MPADLIVNLVAGPRQNKCCIFNLEIRVPMSSWALCSYRPSSFIWAKTKAGFFWSFFDCLASSSSAVLVAKGLALYESSIKTLPLLRLIKFILWMGGVNDLRSTGTLRR